MGRLEKLEGYQICGFISYKEDAGRIQALNESLEIQDSSYDSLLQSCDAVILLDNYRDFVPDKYYQVIEDARRFGKEVIITPHALTQIDIGGYQGQFAPLELLPEGMPSIDEEYELNTEINIYSINTPIIGVLGYGKHCGKFHNQLLLKDILETDYRTVTVASNALGALFGCYTLPSFFYEGRPFQEKIVKFNYYIRSLVKTHDPEVIVLGVPEGIAPFAKREFHHFAEYPLVISSAVPIDTAVLCTYFMSGKIREPGLRKMVDFCMNRYSVPVGAVAISGTIYDIPQLEYEKVMYEFLSDAFLNEYCPDIGDIGFPVARPARQDEAAGAIRACISQLENNVKGI